MNKVIKQILFAATVTTGLSLTANAFTMQGCVRAIQDAKNVKGVDAEKKLADAKMYEKKKLYAKCVAAAKEAKTEAKNKK